MRLSKIEMSGFRGVQKSVVIDVPSGFLVVTGRNGSGKSTVCDAVEYALTGVLRKQKGDTERNERIDDYVWWRGDGKANEPFVQCTFVSQDEKEYTITRSPSGLDGSVSQQELARLFCDEATAPGDALQRLLATSIVRDEEITRLSVDLAETDRFQFVREAIGDSNLARLGQILSEVCGTLKTRENQSKRAYERSRATLTTTVERQSELAATIASESDIVRARAEIGRLLDKPSFELSHVRTEIAMLTERIHVLRECRSDLIELRERQKDTQGANAEIDEAKATVANLEQSRDEIRKRKDNIESEINALPGHRSELAELLTLGDELGVADDRCPLCGSQIDERSYHEHIAGAKTQLDQVAKQRATLQSRLRSVLDENDRLLAEIEKREQHIRTLRARPAEIELRLNDTIRLIRSQLSTQEESLGGIVDQLDSAIVETDSRVSKLRQELRIVESSRISEQVAEMDTTVSNLRKESGIQGNELERMSRAYGTAESFRKAVLRVEGEIIEERLAALGPLLEDLYLRLRPHAEWSSLSYRIRGDVRHFLSFTVGDDLNPRFMFSSGQRRAIGIAFLVGVYLGTGWSRLRSIIFDDPVQHIDDYRSLHLVELLAAIAKTGRQVICTAEDSALAQLMARRLAGIAPGPGALAELEYRPGTGSNLRSYRRHHVAESTSILVA